MPADLSQISFGPKMAACSERERQFVWHYCLNGGNGAQAARDAGYSDPGPHSATVRVRAHELLLRERVLEAIEEVGRKQFRGLLVPAITALRMMLDNPDHPDHVKTASTVLDRLGFGGRMAVDVNVSGSVTVNHTDAALEDLRVLLAMGVPREKLVETFGYSGLERYERMLVEADAKRPKVIEHQP